MIVNIAYKIILTLWSVKKHKFRIDQVTIVYFTQKILKKISLRDKSDYKLHRV